MEILNIMIMADEGKPSEQLCSALTAKGHICSTAPDDDDEIMHHLTEAFPDVALLVSSSTTRIKEISSLIRQLKDLPIVALVPSNALDNIDGRFDTIDDFVTQPYNISELELRLKRLVHKARNNKETEVIRCGDLTMNVDKYEVFVGKRQVVLTFKEYELLKFLMNHQEHVFSRDALLDAVWGDDYYGGDRTVDVHIQRLRSKIEDPSHTFIETVRNIGYRLKPNL